MRIFTAFLIKSRMKNLKITREREPEVTLCAFLTKNHNRQLKIVGNQSFMCKFEVTLLIFTTSTIDLIGWGV